MAKTKPGHLKLHCEEPESAATAKSPAAFADQISEICEAFSRATGWPLRYVPYREIDQDTDLLWSAPVNQGVGATPGHLRMDLGTGASSQLVADLDDAQNLAAALAGLMAQCHQAQTALQEREAELAAGVPIVSRRNQQHLAERLKEILKAGAEVLGGHAAALYMLDEATTQLKLRSCWGLPWEELTLEPRPLEGAIADLEALLGHAVTLESSSMFECWNVPQPCEAAMCLPVSTPTVPIGTLWILFDSARQFSDQQTAIAELVAGRIAVELEREMLLSQITRRRDS